MGLLDDLKKKAMGAIAQVNPLDGGKTYASYNPAPVAPVQQKIQTAKYGVLANNPQTQQNLTNSMKPASFNPIDTGFHSLTKSAYDIGKGIGGAVGNTLQTPYSAARYGAAAVTNNQPALNNAKKALGSDAGNNIFYNPTFNKTADIFASAATGNANLNKNFAANQQMADTIAKGYGNTRGAKLWADTYKSANDNQDIGNFLAPHGLTQNSSLGDTVKKVGLPIVSTAAQIALNATGAGAGARVAATQTAEQLAKTAAQQTTRQAFNQVAKPALGYGMANAGIAGADTLANGGSNLDALENAAIGLGTGAALPIAGYGAGKVASNLIVRPQLSEELLAKRNSLLVGYNKALDSGRTDLAQGIAQQIKAIDQTTRPRLNLGVGQGGGYNGGKKSKNFDTAPNTPQENPIETTKYQSGSKELADTLNTDLSGKNITIDTDAGPVSGKVVKNNPSRVTTSEQTWSIGGITQKETLYSNNDSSIILEQPDGSRTAIKGRMVNGLQVEGTPVQNPLGGTPKKSAKQVDMEKRYYQSQLNTLSPNTIGYKEAVAKLNELENAPAQNPLGKEGAPIEKTPQVGKPDPTAALKQEALKYGSAEEFADSLNAMKYGKVTGVGQLPVSKINKTQIKALTERGLPHTDTNLKVSDFKPGRQVTQPLEVYSKGGSWVVENGNHRLAQALANGDETVPVVFKGGEGKKYSTPITDLYNQAHAEATQTPQAPKVEAPTGAPIEKPTLSPKNQAESVVTDPNQLKTSQPLEQGPQTGTLKSPLGNPLDTIIPQESIQTPQQGIKNAKETAQGKAPQGATAKLVESVRAQGSTSEDIIQAIDPTRTVKTNQETWTNAGQKLYELGDDGALNYFHENHGADANAVAWRLYEKRLANGDKQGAQTLLADMTTRSIENGQAAQAWAMIKRLDPKFIVQKLDRQVNTFVNANPKLNGRIDWSADKQAKIMQFAEGMANDKLITKLIKANDINSIAKLTGITDSKILKGLAGAKDPERVKMLLNANLNKEINSILPSKFGDKAMAYWKSGLLSAPVTHVRNIIGNTVNAAFGAIETPLAGGFDATVGRALTPTKRTVSANPLRGALTGAKMGAQDFSDALKYGLTKDDTGKFNYKSINWNMNNPVERYVFKPFTDTIFRTLGAEDKLFKQPAIVTSLYNMADAAAISAGKRGDVAWMNEWVKNAPAAVLDQAKAEGGIAVFQKDTVVSTGMQGLRQAIKRKHPGYEKIVEAIQPFVNVPAAIGSELLTYTPAGLLRVGNKARKALDKNLDLTTRDVYRRQAMKDLSKTTVGGGLIMAGLAMGYNGDATGAAPTKGTKEYEQWVLENKQPNSIKIGGKWFNINSVGPQLSLFNAAAQTGASMRQDAQKGKTTGFADNAITLTGNIGKNFMDSSSLTGATDASNALKDPKRYARNYAARQATSFIPNIAKRAGSGFDPYQRETSSFKDAVQAQIPVARNDLPARVDSLGNPVKNNAYGGYGLKALFDPFNTSTAKTSPVIDELSKLSKSGQNATPTGIDANTTISGVKVSLTPNQHNEINTLVGKATNDGFGTFMNTPEYKAMNDEQRKKVLESYQNDISTAKKQQFAADNGIGPYANGAENSKPLNVREQKVLEGTSTITDYMPKQSKTKVRGVAKTSTKKVSVKRASTKKVKLAKIKIPKSPKIKVGKMKSARMIKVGVKSRSKVKIRTKV